MFTRTKRPFGAALRSLFFFILSRSRQVIIDWFAIPCFDIKNEHQARQQLQTNLINTWKIGILTSVIYFMVFIALVALNNDLSEIKAIAYCFTAATLITLFVKFQRNTKINQFAKLAIILWPAGLIGLLMLTESTVFYNQIWLGLLPVYFLTYGQLLMSFSASLTVGLLTMMAIPISGYLIGIETTALLPSMTILLTLNMFGFCNRYQLEAHARQLFQERRKAEQAMAEKTLFLRQLSHNLRQPLNALNCYASVLDAAFIDHQNQQNQLFQQMAGKLGLAIDDLNCTFNRILDIANLETGQQTTQLADININLLLSRLENQFSQQAAKRGLKLIIQQRTRPPYSVYSDPGILNQILGNLIDNAIKYTQTGWVIVAAVKSNGNQLKVHVRDSGIGIDKEHHTAIFKEFFRCNSPQIDTHGLGIGLAYVIKAVECLPKHNLQVSSQLNRGSDFQLCLPTLKTDQPM